MSSILLANPFVMPPPTAQPSGADPSANPLAVAPTSGAMGSADTGSSTAFSGQGSGYGSGSGHHALMALASSISDTELANATPDSVFSAQAQTDESSAIIPYGENLPDFEMPKILPTAPWFRDTHDSA